MHPTDEILLAPEDDMTQILHTDENEEYIDSHDTHSQSPKDTIAFHKHHAQYQYDPTMDALMLPSSHPLAFELQHADENPPVPMQYEAKRGRATAMENSIKANFSSLGEKAKYRVKNFTQTLVSARKMDSETSHAEQQKKKRGSTLPRPVRFLEPYETDATDEVLFEGMPLEVPPQGKNKRKAAPAGAAQSPSLSRRSLTVDQVLDRVVKPLMENQQGSTPTRLSHLPLKAKFVCRPLPGIVSSPTGHRASPSSPVDSPARSSLQHEYSPIAAATPTTPITPITPGTPTSYTDFPEFMTITRNRSTSVANVRDSNVKRFLYEAFTERENLTASQREKEMEEKMKAELRKVWHESSRDLDHREKEIEKALRKRREALARKLVK